MSPVWKWPGTLIGSESSTLTKAGPAHSGCRLSGILADNESGVVDHGIPALRYALYEQTICDINDRTAAHTTISSKLSKLLRRVLSTDCRLSEQLS